jgi:ATP-binding cassette, subfamily B (MDR/TAP), member 1
MEEFSFFRSGTHPRRRSGLGPFPSPDNSTSFAGTPGARRQGVVDVSWQSSVSWQTDTSRAQPHGLGAAVEPWAPVGNDSASRRGPALFRRTTRDYYLSMWSSRKYRDRSSAMLQTCGGGSAAKRLELQSFVTDASRAFVVAPNTSFASNDDDILSSATAPTVAAGGHSLGRDKTMVKYSDTYNNAVSREVSFSRDNHDKL